MVQTPKHKAIRDNGDEFFFRLNEYHGQLTGKPFISDQFSLQQLVQNYRYNEG